MVEPIRDVLYSTMHSEQAGTDKRWSSMLSRQLQEAEVELEVPLAATTITLGDIMNLKAGDVVPVSIEELVNARVSGVPVMECRYGLRNGQYALKIQRFLAQEEPGR
jgi:flagellar motor switch protein FliM